MPNLNMNGAFVLNSKSINEQVTRTEAGNYALGKLDGNTFYVSYVGRSDSDVNGRLQNHATAGKYSHFMFSYATSPKAAFEKECQNFHDFGGEAVLANLMHPDLPNGANWKCPVCK
ncbi:hypothetical protein [Aeromonas enteropelogenes]|uniref:hypothetical protein n=1 Tax=Aeromonas enteropelogenes TaxID=29489 RepID=UPI003B9F5224